MVVRICLLVCVTACGFKVTGQSASDAPAGEDAPSIDAPSDAPIMIDASTDAPIMIDAPPMGTKSSHPAAADTFLASDSPTSNFSTQSSALVDGDTDRTMLIRFDLTSISLGATVSTAELHIWTDYDPGGTCTLYPVLESWDEGSTTWNKRNVISNWLGAGASTPSRGTTAVGTVTPSTAFTEYTIVIDPALVTSWIAAPATNFGLVFVTTDMNGTRFATKENGNPNLRPHLIVTHTP